MAIFRAFLQIYRQLAWSDPKSFFFCDLCDDWAMQSNLWGIFVFLCNTNRLVAHESHI